MRYLKYIKAYESFDVLHIKDLKKGDIITYQGSRCEVVEGDEFVVKVKSLQTGKEFTINQGQLSEHGIKLV